VAADDVPGAASDRCPWAGDDPLMVEYHDTEWGAPTTDDRELLELLVLEGAQAGLSWRTVLHRREGYRRAFAHFDPQTVAAMGPDETAALLTDPGIVRNRAKVASAVRNAGALLEVADQCGSFATYLWAAVDGRPVIGGWDGARNVPVTTPTAVRLSTDLKRRGFNFVGPTIVYSLMQAAGLVMDHLTGCFRYSELLPGKR
jgi:DNA-3-methyladenine glycosylase I